MASISRLTRRASACESSNSLAICVGKVCMRAFQVSGFRASRGWPIRGIAPKPERGAPRTGAEGALVVRAASMKSLTWERVSSSVDSPPSRRPRAACDRQRRCWGGLLDSVRAAYTATPFLGPSRPNRASVWLKTTSSATTVSIGQINCATRCARAYDVGEVTP